MASPKTLNIPKEWESSLTNTSDTQEGASLPQLTIPQEFSSISTPTETYKQQEKAAREEVETVFDIMDTKQAIDNLGGKVKDMEQMGDDLASWGIASRRRLADHGLNTLVHDLTNEESGTDTSPIRSVIDSTTPFEDKKVVSYSEDNLSPWEQLTMETSLSPTRRKEVVEKTKNNEIADYQPWLDSITDNVMATFTTNRRGNYVVNGVEYSPAELKQGVSEVVRQDRHDYLYKNSTKYRDEIWVANTGKTYEDFYRDKILNTYVPLLKKLRDEAGERAYDKTLSQADDIKRQAMYGDIAPENILGASLLKMPAAMVARRNARQRYDDALEHIYSLKYDDFGTGFQENFDLLDISTLGISGMIEAARRHDILDKKNKGYKLSNDDEAIYQLMMIEDEIDQVAESVFGEQSLSNKVGGMLGTTTSMAPSFAMGMGLTGGIGSFAKVGAKGAVNATREAAKKSIVGGIGRGLWETSKIGGRLAYNFGVAEARGLAAATFDPHTWENFSEKRTKQYSWDSNGNLVYTPTEEWEDIYHAMVEQANEYASEFAGAGINSLLRGGAKVIGRVTRLDKVVDKVLPNRVKAWQEPSWWRTAMRNIGYSGDPISESVSEIMGDVMTNIMVMPLGREDFTMLKDTDYWLTNFLGCALYGGALQLTVGTGTTYLRERKLTNTRSNAITHINNKELYDALQAISQDGYTEDSAAELAKLPWGDFHSSDIGYAMDFIGADYGLQMMRGQIEENARLNEFGNVAYNISALTYKGADGKTATNEMITVNKDGKRYYVLSGDITNAESMLLCVDADTMQETTMLASTTEKPAVHTVADELAATYKYMFSVEGRMADIQAIRKLFTETEDMTEEQAQRLMRLNGFKRHEAGEEVTLASGDKGVIESYSKGYYDVRIGEDLISVPFYNILAEDATLAQAQSLSFAENELASMENAMDEEVLAEDAKEIAAEMPDASIETEYPYSVGDIITTHGGQRARVLAVYENGDVEVDYNLDNESGNLDDMQNDIISRDEIVSDTTTPDATAEQTESDTVSVEPSAPTPEAEVVPQKEDGTKDYENMSPKMFAREFSSDMGGREAAEEALTKMVAAAQKKMEQLTKKGETLSDANEVIKNKEAIAAEAKKLTLYGDVLNILTPEQVAGIENAAPASDEVISENEATEEVAEEEGAAEGDAMVPREAETTEALIPGTNIIDNGYADQVAPGVRKTINDMATLFGMRVRFLDKVEGGRANGRIADGEIQIAVDADFRGRETEWIMGHEFLHRMRDLAPKQYEELLTRVRAYMESRGIWDMAYANMKATYDAAGEKYTDALLQEEIVANFVGDIAQYKDTFLDFLRENKERKGLLYAIKRVCVWMKSLFARRKMSAETKQMQDIITELNKLLRASAKAATKEGKQNDPRLSLRAIDTPYMEAVERGDMETAQRMVREAAAIAMPETKAVDENGEPKEVYHGTPEIFNVFSKERFGTSTDRGIWGNGFYFSDSQKYAKTYEKRGDKQGRTLSAYLNLNNPLFVSLKNGGNEGAMYFHELMEKHFTDDIHEDVTKTDELMTLAQEHLTAEMMADGYDGVIIEYSYTDDKEYVAFEPNQIKSADPVTYDDNGNVIPLSERFDPEKEDVRYSLKVMQDTANALTAYENTNDADALIGTIKTISEENGGIPYYENVVLDYEEDGDIKWIVERLNNVLDGNRGNYAPYTTGGVRYSLVTEQIENLFNEAVAGKLEGKPITIGTLTSEGKSYLENISGLKFRDKVDFVLNPSDLVHIHNDHFGKNEKDKGNNIPLAIYDIKRIIDVISYPTSIIYSKEEKSNRNLFYFLMDSGSGTYNLLEIYSDRKGNLSAKTYYKTKKDAAQRVMELNKTLLPTSETYSGAILSDTKIPQIFENPKIEPRKSLRGSDKSLVGIHNLTLDKLRKVIKMGGLANPSVAVVDVDKQTHDDYGEYSLILPNNMVDARKGRNAGTWAGDAWTPTYPTVIKRMTDNKAISRFYKDIEALPDAMRSRVKLDFDSFMEGRSASALAYWYLFEKGDAPELVYVPSRYSDDISNAITEATKGSFSMYRLTPEERAKCLDAYIAVRFDGDRAIFEAEMQNRIERLTETIETKKSDRVKKWAQETIDSIKEYGFDYDDVAKFIKDVEYDVRQAGRVDVDATITNAREHIKANNLDADYDAWRNDLDERYGIGEYIFDGFTNSGNRRYLPHTMENASKWMKKQGRQGAVATFPAFGVFIANAIPRMTTLESIRKHKALLGKSQEEYDTFREKWTEVYHELAKKLQPDAKAFDDYGYWRLIEAVGQNDPKAFIKKEYDIDLTEDDMAKLNEMVDAIRTNYPARYFETKFERPLLLNDFVAAVVPNDMPNDVYGRLKDANVEIFEYDKNVEGARQEALLEATDSPNIRFSLRPYNGDVAQKRRDIGGIMKTYNIATNIEIAATKDEYTSALRGYGIEDDSIVDSYAAYLEWENKILLNESAIENPFDMAGSIVHENTHRITQTYYKSAIKNLIKQLPLKHIIEYATDELGYNKAKVATNISNISFEVVNEIISIFAEELTITPMDPGGYVLRQYLLGRMSDDNLTEAFEFVENFRYGDKYKPITTSLYPILREILTTYKNEYERRERVGNITQWNKIRQIDERGEGSDGQPYKEAENRPQGVTRSRGEEETRGEEQRAEVGRHSLRDDVGTILDEYDTEGVKYPSINDVADAIDALIEDSDESDDILEDIINNYRAAQDDARNWGHRMDAGGEDEFEEALRNYVDSPARYSFNENYIPYSTKTAGEEAIEMRKAGVLPSEIYAKTGWWWDDKGRMRNYPNDKKPREKKLIELQKLDGTYVGAGDIERDIDTERVGKAGLGSTTEEQVRIYLKNKHLTKREGISAKYKTYRNAAYLEYKERQRKRREHIEDLRTTSQKIDYILGEQQETSLPYEHQALIKIARGEVRIAWNDTPDGKKKGLASEIGAKEGEKRWYAGIAQEATLHFDEYVHQWWQELGGYENDIDTQDLRNALISALMEASNSNAALRKLRDIYDNDKSNYEDTTALYDHEMGIELAAEDARYEEEIEDYEQNKEQYENDFARDAAFFDDMRAMEGTIADIRKRIDQIKHKAAQRVRRTREDFKERREAISEVKRLIKNTISANTISTFQRNELRRLVESIDKARSLNEVSLLVTDIELILADARIRAQRRTMGKLMKKRLPDSRTVEEWIDEQVGAGRISRTDAESMLRDMWSGRNSSGVSIAKYIDGDTAATLDYLAKLMAPTMRNVMVEDVDAEVRGQRVRKDPELSFATETNRMQNEKRITELTAKRTRAMDVGNENLPLSERYTDEDKAEYAARLLYDSYIRVIEAKQAVQATLQTIDEIEIHYYGMRDKASVKAYQIENLREELIDDKRRYLEMLEAFNDEVMQLMREGRDALSSFRAEQENHKEAILRLGWNALGNSPRIAPSNPTVWQKMRAYNRATINNPYWTYRTALKEIDHLSPNGEGAFYNYFMDNWGVASDAALSKYRGHIIEIAEQMRKALNIKHGSPADVIRKAIERSDMTLLGNIRYVKEYIAGETIWEELPLTIGNAMYTIAMFRQPAYRNSMIKRGIDDKAIDAIYTMLVNIGKKHGIDYIGFMDWVNDSFLPATRLEYDETHRAMFGISMAKERNYFPGRLLGYREDVDLATEDAATLPSTITGAIVNRRKNNLMPDIRCNYFKTLMEHVQEMDNWSSFAPLTRDLNTLLSDTTFKNMCNAYMPGVDASGNGAGSLYTLFKTVSAVAVNVYHPKSNPIDDAMLAVMKGWAGSNISWRLWTAAKQIASSPVFLFYQADPRMMATYIANLPNVKSNWDWAMENSPSFRSRWESKFAGQDVLAQKVRKNDGLAHYSRMKSSKAGRAVSAVDDAIRKIAVDYGMTPNAAVDAIVVAHGMRSVYEYELQRMMKKDGNGEPTEGQKKKAILLAEQVFNTTQQSSESAYLSQAQMERTFLIKPLTTYMNSTFAFHRLRVSAMNEIYNQMFNKKYRDIYSKEQLRDARRRAYGDFTMGFMGDFLFAIMGTTPVLLLAAGADDDDKWTMFKNAMYSGVLTSIAGGLIGGNVAVSTISGYKFSINPAWDDLMKDVQRLWDTEWFSLSGLYTALNIASRYQYGFDLKTFVNISKGIDAIIEGSGTAEGALKILNAPQTQINLIAGARRDGETAQQYITRRMRLETLGSTPEYSDVYNEDGKYIGNGLFGSPLGMKEYQANKLSKEYETAYRESVVYNYGGSEAIRTMKDVENDYKDVVKTMGWKADAHPNMKAVEGEYVAPIRGLTEDEWWNLYDLADEVAYTVEDTEFFMGEDYNYYNKVVEMLAVKKQLIHRYNELNK